MTPMRVFYERLLRHAAEYAELRVLAAESPAHTALFEAVINKNYGPGPAQPDEKYNMMAANDNTTPNDGAK